ncbi:hypothetical protein BN137_3663 [Cronobacter condimenti 1330]|uniref:Uncharacterized protein n=1 Tax=Cronobacter condimenti 1330 TaxID=1073999 RepID=K8A3U9_9ENTR|nr:hypothetical protein BN137_3663 [Cronobacter condimenti 1330]
MPESEPHIFMLHEEFYGIWMSIYTATVLAVGFFIYMKVRRFPARQGRF